jgi:hypothetical protein
MYTGAYFFIGAVICWGVGVGIWLQIKLDETNQDVNLPSAFKQAA